MLILEKSYGRLGNQLIVFAHLLGCAMEHHLTLSNPAFTHYAPYFETWDRDSWCRFPLSARPYRQTKFGLWLRRKWLSAVSKSVRILLPDGKRLSAIVLRGDELLDLSSPEFIAAARSKCLLVRGWMLRSPDYVERHADAIRALFRPLETHRMNIARTIAAARSQGDFVVGVHIRQGDYRDFYAGQFYFSPDQYRRFLADAAQMFPERRTVFLICSDEPVLVESWRPQTVVAGPGHLIEDMYSLAECDCVLGPPSTFSHWAAFYGKKPLLHLHSASDPITWDRFVVPAGQANTSTQGNL